MPLNRLNRYSLYNVFVDYFITAASYDANNQPVVLELDPSLFTVLGEYAIVRTLGTISNTQTPLGPTAVWVGGSHPDGYALTAPYTGIRSINSVDYNCILIKVS